MIETLTKNPSVPILCAKVGVTILSKYHMPTTRIRSRLPSFSSEKSSDASNSLGKSGFLSISIVSRLSPIQWMISALSWEGKISIKIENLLVLSSY